RSVLVLGAKARASVAHTDRTRKRDAERRIVRVRQLMPRLRETVLRPCVRRAGAFRTPRLVVAWLLKTPTPPDPLHRAVEREFQIGEGRISLLTRRAWSSAGCLSAEALTQFGRYSPIREHKFAQRLAVPRRGFLGNVMLIGQCSRLSLVPKRHGSPENEIVR